MRQSAATEAILKKLVEAEVDGQTIADQAAGFTDAIQRLREVSSRAVELRSQTEVLSFKKRKKKLKSPFSCCLSV